MVQAERVTHAEAQVQQKRFIELVMVEQEVKIEVPTEKLHDEWSGIVPRSQWGNVSGVSAHSHFIKEFQRLLTTGKDTISGCPNGNSQLEEFVDISIRHGGYERIYRAKGNPDLAKTENDKLIAMQHSSSYLMEVRTRLNELKEKIKQSDAPEKYKDEYFALVEQELQYISSEMSLGTPDFTKLQKSPKKWREFIDIEASRKSGTIVLPFEKAARQALMKGKEARIAEKNETMEEVLSVFNFSESEREYLHFDEIAQATEINAKQIKKLLEVLTNRMNLQGWQIVISEDVTVINVEPKAKVINVPTDKTLDGRNALYVPSHEIYHALRGENGSKQGLKTLSEGVDDYLATEEGAGAVAEMIMGEMFGHERQLKFAARYLAVSMALKTRINDEGKYEPEYTTQEIYNELVDYGLSDKDAAETVWRIFRGTSLKRNTLFIKVEKNGEVYDIPASECYTKDTAYFEGQMQVFQWIKDHVPVDEGMQGKLTLDSLDFSDQFLARVGLSREELEKMEPETKDRALRYAQLVKLGRETLIDVINVLGVGKMRLDFLEDGSDWYDLLRFGRNNGMIDYGDILKPKEFKKA